MLLDADNTMSELTGQSGAWPCKVSKRYHSFPPSMLTVPTEYIPRGEESNQISMILSVFVRVLLSRPSVTAFTDPLHLTSSQ